mgnify:CR=1 FL=1
MAGRQCAMKNFKRIFIFRFKYWSLSITKKTSRSNRQLKNVATSTSQKCAEVLRLRNSDWNRKFCELFGVYYKGSKEASKFYVWFCTTIRIHKIFIPGSPLKCTATPSPIWLITWLTVYKTQCFYRFLALAVKDCRLSKTFTFIRSKCQINLSLNIRLRQLENERIN